MTSMLLVNIGGALLVFRNTEVTVWQADICLCMAKLITSFFVLVYVNICWYSVLLKLRGWSITHWHYIPLVIYKCSTIVSYLWPYIDTLRLPQKWILFCSNCWCLLFCFCCFFLEIWFRKELNMSEVEWNGKKKKPPSYHTFWKTPMLLFIFSCLEVYRFWEPSISVGGQ